MPSTSFSTERLELRPVRDEDIALTEAQLGYLLDPAYGGHGYATEAVTGDVAYVFDRLGVRRITAGCFADNFASVRVLEKVGTRREQHGVGDSWHAELGWLDGYTYALLAETWRLGTERQVRSYAHR